MGGRGTGKREGWGTRLGKLGGVGLGKARERVREMGEGVGAIEVRVGFRDRGVDGGDGENEICTASAHRSEWGVARGDCSRGDCSWG